MPLPATLATLAICTGETTNPIEMMILHSQWVTYAIRCLPTALMYSILRNHTVGTEFEEGEEPSPEHYVQPTFYVTLLSLHYS